MNQEAKQTIELMAYRDDVFIIDCFIFIERIL